MSPEEERLMKLIVGLKHPSDDKEDLERQKGLATFIFLAALTGDLVEEMTEEFLAYPDKTVDEMYKYLDDKGYFPELIFTDEDDDESSG